MNPWTPEMEVELRSLWKRGLSASQIAKKIGGVTRNAVIGKIHRLGLGGRVTPSRPLSVLHVKRERGRDRTSPIRLVPKARPPEPPMPAVSQIALNIALLDLTPSMCRWATAYDGEHKFCGHDRESEDTPYCAAHRAAAVNTTLTAKVKKRARTYQKYMIGLTRFERQAA